MDSIRFADEETVNLRDQSKVNYLCMNDWNRTDRITISTNISAHAHRSTDDELLIR